jgi:hypothetical protein
MSWSLFGGAARRERLARESEITNFRRELDAAGVSAGVLDAEAIGRFETHAAALGLTEDDNPIEVELLDGLRELAALKRAVERDGLPVVETQHRILGGERCRFTAPATRVDGADGSSGRLFLTDGRALFLDGSVTGVPWSSIAEIIREARDLVLAGPARRHQFRLNTFADALRAAWLADHLSNRGLKRA